MEEASGFFSKLSHLQLNPLLDLVSPLFSGLLLSIFLLILSSTLSLLLCKLHNISDTLQHLRSQAKPARLGLGHWYRHARHT